MWTVADVSGPLWIRLFSTHATSFLLTSLPQLGIFGFWHTIFGANKFPPYLLDNMLKEV